MMHMFDTEIATKFGINAAVIFQNIAFWCDHSRANGTNLHDGLHWTYNSVKAFQDQFPYLGKSQISGALQKLIDEGLIVKGNYNKVAYDRTAWYAVTELGETMFRKPDYAMSENLTFDLSKIGNGNAENRKPIPDINPNIQPNKYIGRTKNGFTKPTVEEIRDFITENHFSINPEDFYDYYESNGWMVGKSHMKDWKATVRRWERNMKPKVSSTPPPPPKPKRSFRMVVRLLDRLHMEQMGVLYEDGEIKARGKFYYGRVNGDDLYIEGDETTKRWEDAKCSRGTQLSDFFP